MLVVLRALKLWVPALAESKYQDHNLTFSYIFINSNPFKPNGISHCYQLTQTISVLRVVGLYFTYLFKFQ